MEKNERVANMLKDLEDKGYTIQDLALLVHTMGEDLTDVADQQGGDIQESLYKTVTKMMHEIGVPPHIQGFQYLRKAIIMAVENPKVMEGVTKVLYPGVAKEFETTSSRVERALRHAIEVAWDRGDIEVLERYFGNTVSPAKGKPTNSEFIAMLADYIIIQNM